MHVCTGHTNDDSSDNCQDLLYELALHRKYAVEVRVYGTKSSVYVNGELASQKTIGTRAPLDQVDIYIGDPWHEAADAVISDVSFTEAVEYDTFLYFSRGSQQITRSVEGRPDAVVIAPPTDYSLRFTIEPKGKVDNWGSILFFTPGGTRQRVPGIIFYPGSTKLQVRTDDSDGMEYQDLPYELALHRKHAIEVRVYGTKSSVYVDGKLASQMTIGTRAPLDKVYIYIGSPWYTPADAIISDVSFTEALRE